MNTDPYIKQLTDQVNVLLQCINQLAQVHNVPPDAPVLKRIKLAKVEIDTLLYKISTGEKFTKVMTKFGKCKHDVDMDIQRCFKCFPYRL